MSDILFDLIQQRVDVGRVMFWHGVPARLRTQMEENFKRRLHKLSFNFVAA
jgi:hypothetical protein